MQKRTLASAWLARGAGAGTLSAADEAAIYAAAGFTRQTDGRQVRCVEDRPRCRTRPVPSSRQT